MPLTLPTEQTSLDRPPARRPCRRWRDKFRDAFRGVKLGVRGHSTFFVHFFCAALVVAAALTLQCDVFEWAVLLGCVGGVLTAELFNSSVETLFHGLDPATKHRLVGVLDIAAGAVLMASITAAVVGGLVLGHRLLVLLG
jgi:diacylglycerol kinase